MVKNSKLMANMLSSIGLKIVIIISGFILPRLIITTYGSETNGLVATITQYLGLIAFLEFGVGAVVQSTLYRSLAAKDNMEVSVILASAQRFFNKLGIFLGVYVIFLIMILPYVINGNVNVVYSAMLIVSISVSMFAQYFFGIVNTLLLNSDQKIYVSSNIQTVTIIANTIISIILIDIGADICTVKFISSVVFLIRPIYLSWYVKGHYNLIKDAKYNKEPIKQKWNGFAQHIMAIGINSAPVIILSVLGSLSMVSVYSVYNLIITGVQSFILSYYDAIKPYIGKIISRGDEEELSREFKRINWIFNNITTLLYAIASVLIIPFIEIYMNGNIEYIIPSFSILFIVASAFYCYHLPYNAFILGLGHFKETQNNYFFAVVIDFSISAIGVYFHGIIGVAYGLLAAMLYQTLWTAHYDCKFIKNFKFCYVTKQLITNIFLLCTIYCLSNMFSINEISYFSWTIHAMKVSFAGCIIVVVVNLLFYREYMMDVFKIR